MAGTQKPAQRGRRPGTRGAKHSAAFNHPDEDKIAAVAAMTLHGGLTTDGQDAARHAIGHYVSTSTLGRWWIEYRDRVGVEAQQADLPAVVKDVANQVISNMQQALVLATARMTQPETINAITPDKLALFSAILIDKLRAIGSISPEEEQAFKRFATVCQRFGLDAIETLNDYTQSIEAVHHQARPDSTIDLSRQMRTDEQ